MTLSSLPDEGLPRTFSSGGSVSPFYHTDKNMLLSPGGIIFGDLLIKGKLRVEGSRKGIKIDNGRILVDDLQ